MALITDLLVKPVEQHNKYKFNVMGTFHCVHKWNEHALDE